MTTTSTLTFVGCGVFVVPWGGVGREEATPQRDMAAS